MRIQCDLCDESTASGAKMFRCEVCKKAYCAQCLCACAENPSDWEGVLNNCDGCKALTMEFLDGMDDDTDVT